MKCVLVLGAGEVRTVLYNDWAFEILVDDLIDVFGS